MKLFVITILLVIAAIGCQGNGAGEESVSIENETVVVEPEKTEPIIWKTYRIFNNELIARGSFADDEYQSVDDILNLYNQDDLLNVTFVDLSENNLTSMAGVERLVNVESLGLYNNNLTTIEGLTALEHLTRLELKLNAFEDVSELLELRGMEYINIVGENNEISVEYFKLGEQVAENNPGAHVSF